MRGPAVKLNMLDPTPSTNMAVRTPRVAPNPRMVMMMAFAGRIMDPNTNAMRMNVAAMM